MGKLDRLLVVHGEGNGWPARMSERPRAELVQWLAVRPATGERFGALVRPSATLSPTLAQNQGLALEDFEAALSPSELADRWSKFARADDVWCAWGYTAVRLLAAAGVPPAPIVDARSWSHAALKARAGRIEGAHATLGKGEAESSFPGRGGRRIAMLAEIVGVLAERCEGPPKVEPSALPPLDPIGAQPSALSLPRRA